MAASPNRRNFTIHPVAPRPGDPSHRKGRGTVVALAHRFTAEVHEAFDDGWAAEAASTDDAPPPATQVFEEHCRSILAKNDSPDVGFELSVNPYRGCEHGCIYCFARPTHSYLNLSPGVDFETRIVAKVNAAERLRAAFAAPGYVPRRLNLGSATDAWQPVERRLRLTRGVVEVLSEHDHAFTAITKSSGIERDLDLLAPMAARRLFAACVSVTTLDNALARTLEPRAAAPARRLQTIRRLAEAGVPVGVSVSPIIPFVNEPELERILEAAREAGATSAFTIVLRLPWEVDPLFRHWLDTHLPQRAARVMARVRELHGGDDYDAAFGTRMTGAGVWAALLRRRFERACDRLGLRRDGLTLDLSAFRRPACTLASDAATAPRGRATVVATHAAEAPRQQELF